MFTAVAANHISVPRFGAPPHHVSVHRKEPRPATRVTTGKAADRTSGIHTQRCPVRKNAVNPALTVEGLSAVPFAIDPPSGERAGPAAAMV